MECGKLAPIICRLDRDLSDHGAEQLQPVSVRFVAVLGLDGAQLREYNITSRYAIFVPSELAGFEEIL